MSLESDSFFQANLIIMHNLSEALALSLEIILFPGYNDQEVFKKVHRNIEKGKNMSNFERKMQIIDLLNHCNGVMSMEKLSRQMFVSRSTLRRDLIQMEKEGMILRHHGGISLIPRSAAENSVELRKMENPDKKSAIARRAAPFIHDNMVLFLDSSSTVSYLLPILKSVQNLTVVTNGIHVASQLNTADNLKCYLCPGLLKHKSLSIIGEYAIEFLNNFRAETVFFSCKAIRPQGIFEGDDSQALYKRNMLRNSDKKILLCDNSKEFATGYFKLVEFSDIDMIISNAPFSEALTERILSEGCKILCAE